MRALVTGGAGFVGSALVRRLIAGGHQVRVLDDFSRGTAALAGADVVRADIRDARAVSDATCGCDTVIHLAAVNGTGTFYAEPRRVIDTTVRGTLNVLDACERHEVQALLLASSSEAHQSSVIPTPETVPLTVPDPLNPRYSYGGGKIASELLAVAWQQSGAISRVIIARPHNIYGIGAGYQHVIPEMAVRMAQLMAGPAAASHDVSGPVMFPIQGDGRETRAFCHVSDCADALALLLERAGPLGIYHVGNPEEVTMECLAHLIGEHYGTDVKVVPGELRAGGVQRRCPDIGKLRALGFEPKISLRDGIGEVLDWYAEHPAPVTRG